MLLTPIHCLDIGNKTTLVGLYQIGNFVKVKTLSTKTLIQAPEKLLGINKDHRHPISYCSVVPKAEESLLKFVASKNITAYNLNSKTKGSFPVNYPNPTEIGQDRIANSLAAYHIADLPCIVIDVGTATTFDIVSKDGGYEGGVITPGAQGFLDFLSQNTALLPQVSTDLPTPTSLIGRETKIAMVLGAKVGYPCMVEGILKCMKREIEETFNKKPTIIVTGGGHQNLKLEDALICPHLTIFGLAKAYELNASDDVY